MSSPLYPKFSGSNPPSTTNFIEKKTLFIGLLRQLTKNPKPGLDFNGPHYTLNILGENNIGNGQYNNPDRHTIFVPLEDDATITYTLGDDFGVLDGNGLDDGECIP